MFFGLFGNRATTDDSIELMEIDQAYTRATMSANLNMTRQTANRGLEEWEHEMELKANLSKANLELGALRAQVRAFEVERANWKTTAISGSTCTLALRTLLSRSVGKDEAARMEQEEVQALLRDPELMEYKDKWSNRCAANPWRLKKI
jgi:hypothetical protein